MNKKGIFVRVLSSGILFFGLFMVLFGIVNLLFRNSLFYQLVLPFVNPFSRSGYLQDVPAFYQKWLRVQFFLIVAGSALFFLGFLWKRILRNYRGYESNPADTPCGEKREQSARILYAAVVAGISFAGLLMRIPGLNKGFFDDEINTFQIFLNPFGFWRYVPDGIGDHRICSVITYVMMSLFGKNEAVIRFPFFLFGVFSISLIYVFGKEYFSRRIGLLAALLLAFSSFHVLYSDLVRGYSPLMFFTLASSWLFFKIIYKGGVFGFRQYFVFGGLTALGFYSHFYFMMIIVLQLSVLALVVLMRIVMGKQVIPASNRSISNLFAALFIGTFVAFALLGPFFFWGMARQFMPSMQWGIPLSVLRCIGTVATGSSSYKYALIYVVLFTLGMGTLMRTRYSLIGFYAVLAVFVPLLGVKLVFKNSVYRYFIFILPFLILGAVRGITVICRVFPRKIRAPAVITGVICLILLQVPALRHYYATPLMGYRECVQMIEASAGKEDRVYAIGMAIRALGYYQKKYVPLELNEQYFADLKSSRGDVWLIVMYPDLFNERCISDPFSVNVYEYAKKEMIRMRYSHGLFGDMAVYRTGVRSEN